MKQIAWTEHAEESVAERGIDGTEVERAILYPTSVASGYLAGRLYLRLFHDSGLNCEMLLCVAVEETTEELLIVTAYKTSKVRKYLTRGSR